jgi:uncharacterized protein YndB with AHSA1/START domain
VVSRRADGPDFRPDAPVVIRCEREIGAPAEVVWEVLTRVEAWPLWHRGVHFAFLRGDLEEGTALHWRADGMRIRSRVAEVEPGRRVAWTLRAVGGRGFQRWVLEPMGPVSEGGTRVRLEESWEGLAVRLLRGTIARTLRVSRAAWLERLERRSEEANHDG